MASIKALHIEIGARVSGFTRKMRKIRRMLKDVKRDAKKLASGFISMGRKALVGIGLIGTGVILATKRFATFEANLLRVKALTGGTEKDFRRLKATAERMGITTAFTASEAAEAMVKLAQQGRNTEQTMSMLPNVLNLAVVGSLDLAEAARLTGVTLNQFGLSVRESERAADVLAKGASVSATTVEELGEAMTYAGPLSKNLGFSLEETTAVLAAFANVGVTSGRAGRALAAVFAELGAEIRQKGLLGALDELKASGKTADQLMTELNRIAGRSVGSLREVTDEIRDVAKQLKISGGTARNFAQTVLSRTEGAFVRLRSAADGLVNSLGETFAPAVIGGFERITEHLKKSVAFMKEFRGELELTNKSGEGLVDGLLGILDVLLDKALKIVSAFDGLVITLRMLYTPFQALFVLIGVAVGNVLFYVAQLLKLVDMIAGTTAGRDLDNLASGFLDTSADIMNDIGQTFDDAAKDTGSAATQFMRELTKDFRRIKSKFENFQPPNEEQLAARMVPELHLGVHAPDVQELPDLGNYFEDNGMLDITPELGFAEMFPDLSEELGKIPASLDEIQKAFDSLGRKIGVGPSEVKALFEEKITVESLNELITQLSQLDLAVSGGQLDLLDAGRMRTMFLEAAGAFPEIEKDEFDFSPIEDFIDDMQATSQQRTELAQRGGIVLDGLQDLMKSPELTRGVVKGFIELFDQLDKAVTEGVLTKLQAVDVFQALQADILEKVTPEEEDLDPTKGFTESLQTALGAVKVDPFAETSQKRTMKASEKTAKATQEIAKNTKGFGSILT